MYVQLRAGVRQRGENLGGGTARVSVSEGEENTGCRTVRSIVGSGLLFVEEEGVEG